MSDLNIIGSGNPPPPEPSAYLTPFVTTTSPPGTPVYATATADTVAPAEATAFGTTYTIGFLSQPSTAGERGLVKTRGPLTLSIAQWDAIKGGSGGLVPGDNYYLSAGGAGLITSTAPVAAGSFAIVVGVALSAQTLLLGSLPSSQFVVAHG